MEVRLLGGAVQAYVACPAGMAPAAGQAVLAHDPSDDSASLAETLFPAEICADGFWAAPPIPSTWAPGTALALRGPLGRGFLLPGNLRRLALAALGDTPARLLPLVAQATQSGAEVALFCDALLPRLLAAVEIHPLTSLPEALPWADLLALDLPLERLPALRALLGLQHGEGLPCQAQALVWTPMPCAGLARCGACAVPTRRGWKLACEDGPVFSLHELDW
ncbi:MAG: hypothetical protein JW726_06215 [Anaerolineales bacterium]|nr:hypothetical protein [Anaerolineales bacterium]